MGHHKQGQDRPSQVALLVTAGIKFIVMSHSYKWDTTTQPGFSGYSVIREARLVGAATPPLRLERALRTSRNLE